MKIKEMEYGKESRTELLCKDKYKNYNYYILNLGTHPTAYIEIPKEDKLYRKSCDEIYRIGCDIDVNGGLTYSDNELMGISSDNWFIGWDYAHYGDYCGYEETLSESIRTYGKKWTTEEIIDECKNAIDQIIEFESKEILEEEKELHSNSIEFNINNDKRDCVITLDENDLGIDKLHLDNCYFYKENNKWYVKKYDFKTVELEEKKIPEKIDTTDGVSVVHCAYKINEIIDYLNSKGDE